MMMMPFSKEWLSSSMNKKLMMMMPFSKEWLSSSMNKKSWLSTLKNLSLVGGMSRAAHNKRPVPPAAPAVARNHANT
ncbi:unnamed protein product [Arabidopsis halleri]